jgi:hypothetical protein
MRPYELEVISTVSTIGPKPKVITKNDKIKKIFDLDAIKLEEYIDGKTGKHIKKYATILDNDSYFKINKPYDELKELILNRSIPVLGLMYKSKRYK